MDTSNPGLLSDCEMLLAARDTLGRNCGAQLGGEYSNHGVGWGHCT